MTYRWQKKKIQASHADDWLMTYADIITLLLCFFAIIIITSVPKKNVQPKILVQPTVEQKQPISPPVPQISAQDPQPQAPDIFSGDLPFHDVGQIDSPVENIPPSLPTRIDEIPPPAKVDETPPPAKAEEMPPAMPTPLPAAVLPETADNLKSQGSANFEQKGDRITMLEMNSAAFFDSGSAVLSNAGISILRDAAISLKSDQFKDYQITVEGHTDDTPIHTTQFPSNWELSTARASAVVHFFLGQDIPASRLRAAGYADTFPKVPNRDRNGNPIFANRAENRRVVIRLEKIEKN